MWGGRQVRTATIVFGCFSLALTIAPRGPVASARPLIHLTPTPAPQAAVINLAVISAQRAAAMLRPLFPHDRITVDTHANALLVVASPDDVQQMRTIVTGIDVRSPQTPTTEIVPLHVLKPQAILPRLRALYPHAHIEAASKTTLLVRDVPGHD